ncbi:MAG TPA: NifU family protein [Patescibacteria group bacterium]|nr:NifU family protein [Patescibacteria group bacterium]
MDTKEKIKNAIEEVRPSLQADGGDVQLMEWNEDEGVVKVQLMGMCAGCPMAQVTLKDGIEKHLKKQVPEVKKVESV